MKMEERFYQRKVLEDKNRMVLVFWDRAEGKSIVAAKRAFDFANQYPNSFTVILGRTLTHVLAVKEYLKDFGLKERIIQGHTFRLENNATIRLGSINSKWFPGHTIDLLILDDIPLWQLMTSEFLYHIMPCLMPNEGQLVIFADLMDFSVHFSPSRK